MSSKEDFKDVLCFMWWKIRFHNSVLYGIVLVNGIWCSCCFIFQYIGVNNLSITDLLQEICAVVLRVKTQYYTQNISQKITLCETLCFLKCCVSWNECFLKWVLFVVLLWNIVEMLLTFHKTFLYFARYAN